MCPAKAQFSLAGCYHEGEGVAKDMVEAVKWYRRAAEQGFAMAQYNLGACYFKGEGVARDAVEGAKWYRQAAKQGDATAQYYLGACYVQGEGVAKDYVAAHKWFSLAGHQGVENAETNLFLVEKEMTTEQIAEAQRLAREFKPHKTPEPGAFPLRQRAKL